MGILNNGGGWSPNIEFSTFVAIRIQLVVRCLELHGHILLLGIAEHEVKFLAVGTSTEYGFSRLEGQSIHHEVGQKLLWYLEIPPPSGGKTGA